jgi:BirA family biotin operon repressor/biotin-[acetyl-CoA-carboxylase] ligase
VTTTDAGLFDLERATAALANAPIGHTIEYVATLPSTMGLARAWAADGHMASGAVVLAESQSAGRGRLDRRWEAPAGRALLLSILLRSEQIPRQPGRLPMIAGLAMLDATAHLVPGLSAGLKWPNDLLVGEDPATANKAAGILVESTVHNGHLQSAVVGIGINVNQSADELPTVEPPARSPTSLSLACGRPLDRTELLIALCRAFAAHLLEPDANLVARWRSSLWTLGRPVTAHNPDGTIINGLAVDITPSGGLVIESEQGRREIFEAGDVSLRPG